MANGSRSLFSDRPLFLLSGLAAIVLGWVASTGDAQTAALVVGLLGGCLLLGSPTALLGTSLAGALIVSGLAMLYMPQLQLVRWGVAAASTLLAGIALFEAVNNKTPAGSREADTGRTIAWLLAGLVGVVLLSGYANRQGIAQQVVGLKSYFQVAGIFVALLLMPWPRKLIDSLPRIVLYTAVLQLPFVVHQYLFLVPLRVGYGDGVVPFDIVAGTFGATEFGGGANAVLSAFMLIVVAVLLALWNNGAISLRRLAFFGAPIMAPIFFNESKVSVLYLFIVLTIIFKNEIVARPARAILSGVFLSVLLVGLMFAYAAYYADESESTGDLVAGTIEQNFSTDTGHGSYYLNRWTTLTFWAREHSLADPVPLLIGHGSRSTREGGSGLDAGVTLASRRYPGVGIGLTGVSALLWETGVVGLALTGSMFWLAFRAAGRLRLRYRGDPYRSGIFSGLQAGVAILALSLFHKSFFVFDIGYQAIIMLLFGYLAYYLRLDETGVPVARAR